VGEGRAYKGLSGNQIKVGVTKMSREENLPNYAFFLTQIINGSQKYILYESQK